jgi:hypothetical protein
MSVFGEGEDGSSPVKVIYPRQYKKVKDQRTSMVGLTHMKEPSCSILRG